MSSAHYVPDHATVEAMKSKLADGTIVIQPGALKVIWGKDPRNWKHDERIFELLEVSWLEMKGSIKLSELEKGARYRLVFNVKVKSGGAGLDSSPVFVMGRVAKEKLIWKKADLGKMKHDVDTDIPGGSNELTFHVDEKGQYDNDDVFSFGLYDIWSGNSKGGLVVNCVKIFKI